jgi:phosphatidylserine/phosphatidylglycerophosphate/cardiolipin synthase-like enzyme
LLDTWKKEQQKNYNLALRELASALEILAISRNKEKSSQKLELVWTGPASKIPVRHTRQVLSQLICGSQKELLIVSFVVFKIPEILELLKTALRRGVIITCVFESPEESGGKITFQGFADFNDEILKQIKILVWDKNMRPISADGKTGTLHAKVAVADRKISFISSANLTVNAMTLNMELGLLISDINTAQEIVEHFEQLMQDGILKSRVIDSCI